MRPLHLAAGVAVLAVAAVLYLLMSGSDPDRGARERPEDGGEPARATKSGTKEAEGRPGLHVFVRVVMPDGSPAGGAEIVLRGPQPETVHTERDGSASIGPLRAGPYALLARKGDAAGALDFELSGTTDLGTLRLFGAVFVRGRVLDANGAPLAGTVSAFREDAFRLKPFRLAEAEPVAAFAATTAASGGYALALPGAGRYRLRAFAPGFLPEDEAARDYDQSRDGLDFYLLPAAEITGVVVDPENAPVAGARVSAARFGPGDATDVRSAEDGSFALPVRRGGTVQVVVRASGFAPYFESSVRAPSPPLHVVLERGVTVRLRAVERVTRRPAGGARVVLFYRGARREGATDERGEVAFELVPTRASQGWGSQRVLYVGGAPWAPAKIDASEREPTDGLLDLGDIELQRGGIVRGRVLEAKTKQPIAGAHVLAFAGSDWMLTMAVAPKTVSGDDGSYELRGVPVERSALLASHEGYVTNRNVRDLFVGMRRGSSLFEEGRAEAVHDLELEPAIAVSGVVLAPDGEPAPDARVARSNWSNPFGNLVPALPGETSTDALGRFRLRGVRSGERVKLLATHREFGAAPEADVVAGSAEPVVLRLAPPQRVVGRVVDADGAAIEGVTVSIRKGRGRTNRPQEGRRGLTDAEGRFVVRNVPAGEITARFDHDGYRVATMTSSVAAGAEEKDLGTVELDRGPTISGTVVDAAGEPLEGVTVWALAQDRPRDPTEGRWNANTSTDAEGGFALFGLLDGSYRVNVRLRGYFGPTTEATSGTSGLRVVMKRAIALTGRVLGAGRPVANAFVRAELLRAGSDRGQYVGSARTDEDGTFEVSGLPPDTPVRVAVSHAGFRNLVVEGVVASAGPRDFALEAGLRVAGVVVDEEGEPVVGVSVRLVVEGTRGRWTRTDDEGRFEMGGLDAGTAKLQVRAARSGFVDIDPVEVRAGDTDVRIVLRRGLTIEGVVKERDGKPAENALVQAVGDDGKPVASDWLSRRDGTFELRGLPEGTFLVRVSRWSGGEQETLAERPGVPAGTGRVEVRLP